MHAILANTTSPLFGSKLTYTKICPELVGPARVEPFWWVRVTAAPPYRVTGRVWVVAALGLRRFRQANDVSPVPAICAIR